MLERVLIAGSGGQGVILVGRILATAAIKDVAHVTFFPSYGAEVRGGSSNCQVILSSNEISSPLVEQFDSMILMNQQAATKYERHMSSRCLTLLNSSICTIPTGRHITAIPATELADETGDICAANFIMLGSYVARKGIIPADEIESQLRQALSRKGESVVEMNIRAFRRGMTT